MNIESLKQYFSNRYEGSKSFLDNIIFPIFGKDYFEDGYSADLLKNQVKRSNLAESTGIRSIKLLGKIYVDIEPLQIFDVTVSDSVMMQRNRVNIQRLIRSVMDQYSCAFMIFHYEDDARWDWRFTFCRKMATREEFTDSKRYTFLLGPGQSCRTAAENFYKLYENRENLEINDIESAFNVEALSREFFSKYREQYDKFVEFITGKRHVKKGNKYVESTTSSPHETLYPIFDQNDKLVRDYVKKLLGRIVFLHFLQKKGWLGVPADKDWGDGDRDFMLHLFEWATKEQKSDFLDSVLEPLFSAGLDTNRTANGDLFDTGVEGYRHCRIPYLNGGLFESDRLDEKKCFFPADYFDELLTMLSQYNFTVDENDPNDAEVGVDPEMLGRIFENLLEDNKDKGTFYTPKEIVQFMCRESLIAYLQTDLNEVDKELVRQFVNTHDAEGLGDLKEEVNNKLIEVKICDPAIGSGAFPMGLLRELFFCRSAIEPNIVEKAADIKRHIIQNNIYGVDIERGAVDIARLRFWLALIVDEKTPETLPNLDFKIMQGNSLLEQYEGVDLSNITEEKRDKDQGVLLFETMADCYRKAIRDRLTKYFACMDHAEKQKLRTEIFDLVQEQLNEERYQVDLKGIDLSANNQFFLWHTWFYDVFSRPGKEGFDIVIGNPPYGAKADEETKKYYKKKYATTKSISGIQKGSLDSYTLFIELGYNLLREGGSFAYIVPLSLTSSDSLTGVHRLLMDNCDTIHISSYAVRPQPVFENAVVDTSILQFQKTNTPNRYLYSTKLHRRGNRFDLQSIVDNLNFVDVKGLTLFGRIPKIGTEIEKSILNKILNKNKLESLITEQGSPIVYRFAGGRYFKVITNYSNGSSAERTLHFKTPKFANSVGCILSSSLSFWFYQIYSDNHNWKNYEIQNFTIPKLSEENMDFLNKLYIRYLKDIEANANIRESSGESTYKVSSFKEYKIVKSKHIIDEIDDYIGPLYGLTEEEINFIKNYELEFRLAGDK